MGAIQFIGAADNTSATATFSVNVPTGTANGDVMLLHVNGNGPIVDPAGWTTLDTVGPNSTYYGKTYYRVASSEPASYSITITGGSVNGGVIETYRGVDNANPINAHSLVYNGSGPSMVFSAVTTTKACTIVGTVCAPAAGTYSSGITSGYVQRQSNAGFFVEDHRKVPAGTYTLGTVTWTAGVFASESTIALNPASAPSIVFVSEQDTYNNSGTAASPQTVNMPTGVVDGDLLLLEVIVNTSGAVNPVITTPSGWQLLDSDEPTTQVSYRTYYKFASSEPASYSVAWSAGTGFFTATITAYDGVDPVNPINAHGIAVGVSSPVAAPSVTTGATTTVVAQAVNGDNTTINSFSGGGYTKRSAQVIMWVADASNVASGTISPGGFTTGDPTHTGVSTIALLPAGGSVGIVMLI